MDALPQLITPEVVKLFESYKVLNGRELQARYDIMLETYNKVVNIEAQLMVLLANRYILPAAFEYQGQLGQSLAAVAAAGASSPAARAVLDSLIGVTNDVRSGSDALASALEHGGNGSADSHAVHFRDAVIPAMEALRKAADALELVIPHETWPLPTYREMLFVK